MVKVMETGEVNSTWLDEQLGADGRWTDGVPEDAPSWVSTAFFDLARTSVDDLVTDADQIDGTLDEFDAGDDLDDLDVVDTAEPSGGVDVDGWLDDHSDFVPGGDDVAVGGEDMASDQHPTAGLVDPFDQAFDQPADGQPVDDQPVDGQLGGDTPEDDSLVDDIAGGSTSLSGIAEHGGRAATEPVAQPAPVELDTPESNVDESFDPNADVAVVPDFADGLAEGGLDATDDPIGDPTESGISDRSTDADGGWERWASE